MSQRIDFDLAEKAFHQLEAIEDIDPEDRERCRQELLSLLQLRENVDPAPMDESASAAAFVSACHVALAQLREHRQFTEAEQVLGPQLLLLLDQALNLIRPNSQTNQIQTP